MSLLSYIALRREIQNKVVRPVPDANVNASSIDVRLGAKLLAETRDPKLPDDELTVLELGQREPLFTEEFDITAEPFLLYPGCFVLAHTLEEFDLPLHLSAEFRLKSSVARMGLGHALAVWCDPGWTGSTLTLELHNLTREHVISLRAGDKVGQVVFHRHDPVPRERSYAIRGHYNGDKTATATKPETR
jgi:deoxycytidine triphosphate deaminase